MTTFENNIIKKSYNIQDESSAKTMAIIGHQRKAEIDDKFIEASEIYESCNEYLRKLEKKRKDSTKDQMTMAVEYTLNNPAEDNMNSLGYILHSENKLR